MATHGTSYQGNETVASAACAVVLANAARHADAMARAAVGLLRAPGSSSDNGGAVARRTVLRLTAATVLRNAQRHVDALRRAGGGARDAAGASAAAGGGAFTLFGYSGSGGGGTDVGRMQQESLPVLAEGEKLRWRPEQVQALMRYLSSLPAGATIHAPHAATVLGYELWMADTKAHARFKEKLHQIRRHLDHGRDPLAGHDPKGRAPPGTYKWKAWMHRAFRALPNMTGTVSDVAAILEADPDIAPRLDWRPNPSCRDSPMWRQGISRELRMRPELVKTGARSGQLVSSGRRGARQAVYRLDEEVAALQLDGRRPKAARKRGVPGLPQLGRKCK